MAGTDTKKKRSPLWVEKRARLLANATRMNVIMKGMRLGDIESPTITGRTGQRKIKNSTPEMIQMEAYNDFLPDYISRLNSGFN